MLAVLSQGTESFTNIPTATPASYLSRTWTGDNGLTWTAGTARTDGPAAGSMVTGMTGAFIIVRNTTGIITCNNIPNGCGTLSFKYAKAFTAASGIPTFGLFINGTQYGVTTTASSNAAALFSASVNVSGSFNLEIRELTADNNGRLAIDDVSWSASGGGTCAAPAAQGSGLSFPTVTANSISGTFTGTAASGYLVVRSPAATLSANPVDGTNYTAGTALGGGTVVSSGSGTTFTDNGLTASTTYYYFVFAYNNAACTGGPAYNIISPLTGNTLTAGTAACTTPAIPTNINFTASNTAVSGTFTASGASQYLVIISTSNSLSTNVLNGTTYPQGTAIGNGTVISNSANTFFTASALSPATQYYFFVYAENTGCTGEPFYSATTLNGNIFTTNNAGGIPAGYYDAAAGLSCGNLKTALSSIITAGQVTLSYGALDDVQIPIADTIRSDDGQRSIIWDIYTNNVFGPEPFEYNSSQNPVGGFCGGSASGCWNKEHTFPQSWFGSTAYPVPYADLFIVRPTDITVNGKRGNSPYSVVGGTTSYTFPATATTYPGVPILDKVGASTAAGVTASSAFEPSDGVKGDIAREYFYVLTRYQNNLNAWTTAYGASGNTVVIDGTTNGGIYPSFQLPYLQLMYSWHLADPVDARELNYNNLVYSQQSNRNPFIDHPEYVAQVFQCTGVVPVTLIDFSAQKLESAVLLRWLATQEISFSRYELERSVDGVRFNTIGSVAAQNLGNYDFTDGMLPRAALLYYRLKLIDLDGHFRYSKIVSVPLDNNLPNVQIYPNPVATNFHISLPQAYATGSSLVIVDLAGRIVKSQLLAANTRDFDIDVKSLATGRYLIRISNERQVINQSFMIAR